MNNPLLQIQNLGISFTGDGKTTPAVANINIEVQRGELVAIVGESGSGKTVTSLAILRLLPSPPAKYVSGAIKFTGKTNQTTNLLVASNDYMRKIRGNEISMIFQEPMSSLNPVHTCGNQVMEAILLHQNINKDEARKRTIELLQRVDLPDPGGLFLRYPHQLSGGQKQRVMIAMAMSCNPALLICDEPTTALDVTVQKRILFLIKELQQQQNMGVIFITHDLGVVAEIADKVVVMYKGDIVEQGAAEQIYKNPQHPYTKALLACRPALHVKGERLPVVSDFMDENNELRNSKASVKSSGFKVQGLKFKGDNTATKDEIPEVAINFNRLVEPVQPPTPILRVENLKVWFPGKRKLFAKSRPFIKAVDDVSFEVYEGETLGLVGESGCGKTTLGRTILRLIEPTAGNILFKGKDLIQATTSELRQLRKDIQIIFQDPYSSLNPRITIGSAIAEPLKVHKVGSSDKDRKARVMALLEKVNLHPDFYYRYPHEFSGGQRQRIVIARALALNPAFVICDESVSALDVSVQAQVLNLLNDLKKEFGFTAIFISHDLSVVHYVSDRIMVMNKGKIEETGDADSIYRSPRNPYTQKLIASIPKDLSMHNK